ncbi:retrovirus-related pol polyprotein from transposon TNT 1-94 [Tanacetum coccineum]
MSAIVCGKRSSFFEDPSQSPPSNTNKRIRCFSSSPRFFALDRLSALFPDMDKQVLERTLNECGDDIETAIKSLTELRLVSVENTGYAVVKESEYQNQPQGVSANGMANGNAVPAENSAPQQQQQQPVNGADWVDLFVQEMLSASNIDDARTRASRALELLEKSICERVTTDAHCLQQENMMMKEQLQALVQENSLLKRAVAIQHERQKEYEDRGTELNTLKQMVSQYQEQLRTLEVTKLMKHDIWGYSTLQKYRLMEISKADHIALDDALVSLANRLKIGKCNLHLSLDVTSKEATLQVVYDVLKLTPFYKAFQVSPDVPEIYMQELWASAYIHNLSVRFKMNNKKHILNLDQFRDILQICLKVGNKKFEEPPLEKEILAFLASLGHSGEIRKITDVTVNKLHQPWRSFAAIINKCLSGKPSYDSLRLSQAQILWGMYNNKKVDYAYLLWEDFIYQIENKNTKKGNAMYYPRFTKLVVNFVMDKDPSIPRRNKVNWHYARDDPMFTTINVISRNEDTQLYGTILPVALTNKDIRNSESYKEYYAIASGKILPKTKGSKKKADTDTTTKQKPPTIPKEKKEKKSGKGKQKAKELETISEAVLTEAEQLKIITKRSRKETYSSHASRFGANEGTGVTPGVPNAPDYDSDDDISWKSSDDDQDDDKINDDDRSLDIPVTAISRANLLFPNQSSSNTESSLHSITTTTNPDTGYYSKFLIQNLPDFGSSSCCIQLKYGQNSSKRSLTKINNSFIPFDEGMKKKLRREKRILIDKLEANNSITGSDIQKAALLGISRCGLGGQKKRQEKKLNLPPSAPAEETMKSTDVSDEPATLGGLKQGSSPLYLPFMRSVQLGPTFELMKGTCKSLTDIEYFSERSLQATQKFRLDHPKDANNPHDLRKPLPLVLNSQGRHIIPFHHFINNDLEYLRGGESSLKYSTSVTKTKAADYAHIRLDRRTQLPTQSRDVYSKRRIIAVTKVEIVEWQNYKHLDWITVRRDDDILYRISKKAIHRLSDQE